jgi:cholesterol transport system auxiliary component
MSWTDRRGMLRMGAGAPLALTGCATLLGAGGGSAPTVYRLTPKPVFPAKLPRVDWVLIVAEPAAEGTLDSDQIAVPAQGRVSRLAGVAWSDRATAMLQFVIVQAFQASGRLPAVGTDRDDLPGRYLLQSTLDAFQLEPDGDGYAAHVDLRVLLLRLPGREIAGAHAFSRRMAAPEASNAAAVAAFDAAVGGVLADLVAWTLATGRR